jgi:glycosyltransferase involved in cell wall biosynthesis
MKVSVAVTTYNHENYIAQALDSVLMQKVNFDYEIIIGEDYSADNTRNIVIDFQKRYPDKIELILPHENLGSGGVKISLQVFQACKGAYIAFLDGDDYWTSPHKLQKQVDFLDSHPEHAMCFHNAKVFYEDKSSESWNLNPINQKEVLTLEDLLAGNVIATSSSMVRSDLVSEFPDWFYTAISGDWVFFILYARHGDIGYINEVMSVYRIHPKGYMSRFHRIQQLQGVIELYPKINELLNFHYDTIIKSMTTRRYYELSLEYENHGDMDKASFYLTKCIDERPQWLEEYLPNEGFKGTKVWGSLQRKLWLYKYPFLYRLLKHVGQPIKPIQELIKILWIMISTLVRIARKKNIGIITADPNPIQERGRLGVGETALSWITKGVAKVEIHVGAPDGPLFFDDGAAAGSAITGEWVHDGMLFYLQDVSGGKPLTFANTLDIVKVNLVTEGRFVNNITRTIDWTKKKIFNLDLQQKLLRILRRNKTNGIRTQSLTITKATGLIKAKPNPILRIGHAMVGKTNLSWKSYGTSIVEVHVGAPDGPLFSRTRPSGSGTTSKWVQDGMVFYLQDVSGEKTLVPENTLATVTVDLLPFYRFLVKNITGVIDWLKKKLSHFLKTKLDKYDIGQSYDPLHSLADLLMRHLYARLFQKESFNLRKQITKQYRGASLLFHLRWLIRKLKLGKIPIRIIFLAQDSLAWLFMDSLYRACVSDPLFKTYVINIGFHIWGIQEECSAYLAKNNIEYLDGNNDQIRLDLLNPDIIVTSSPYDHLRPYQFRIADLLRYAKLVYIPYGIPFSDRAGNYNKPIFGLDTQKNAWRIFTGSEKTVGSFRKYGGVPSRRVVSLGLPVIDQYYSSSSSGVLPEAVQSASAGKFKIIYTPHHTVDGWSTFLRYGNHIRRLVQENEDCFLVFRPHWMLVETLKDLNLMSEEAFRSFFAGDRCYLYEGTDYNEFFRWSDVLISDASSFLGQYAPTRNPIIYLHREDGWGLDDTIRDDIFKSCYIARSEDEITAIFQQLKNGMDPLKGERERYQENISVGMFTGGAGKRIAAYIRDKLA